MPKPTLRTVIRCDGVRQVRRDGKTPEEQRVEDKFQRGDNGR